MVIAGVAERGQRESKRKVMAMSTDRSKPLHNFSMGCLKWGNQRFLRCMKANSAGVAAGDHSSADRQPSAPRAERSGSAYRGTEELERRGSPDNWECFKRSPAKSPSPASGSGGLRKRAESDGDDGIEAVRAKLMFDLQEAADKIKVTILKEGEAANDSAAAVRPWNLRTRRAACKAPIVGGGGGKSLRIEEKRPSCSTVGTETKSPRVLRGGASPEKKEKTKFSVSLTRREIEEDYFTIIGAKPPRRPKKRPKIVQKQLDSLFPGLWLTEVTADTYKVPELPESGKR